MKSNVIKKISDKRGLFIKFFEKIKILKNFEINQVCLSETKKRGTIRGLHFQKYPFYEDKIVTCIKGKIFDVCVDIRKNSPNYLKCKYKILNGKKFDSVLIKKGFAHGFQTLEDDSIIVYCINGIYKKKKQSGILWNDPKLNIQWPLKLTNISVKDKKFKFL